MIAISANAIEKDIRQAMKAGFEDYLVKPINVGNTLKVIAKLLKL